MTATVRDLRNNFAKLAKHLEWGEEITITRRGKPVAKLSPPRNEMTKAEVAAAWKKRLKEYKPVGRRATKAETEALWSRLRD